MTPTDGTTGGRDDGKEFVYYVMPFVEGETLRDRLNREKQLPVETAVRIAVEVASALEHAHSRGVIHRDIKPENVLLSGGHALVADFGFARSPSGDVRLTATGMSLGTPAYMSPEQAAAGTAFEWLELAVKDRTAWLSGLRTWPELDPIRSDPRLATLIKRVGVKEVSLR